MSKKKHKDHDEVEIDPGEDAGLDAEKAAGFTDPADLEGEFGELSGERINPHPDNTLPEGPAVPIEEKPEAEQLPAEENPEKAPKKVFVLKGEAADKVRQAEEEAKKASEIPDSAA